MPIVELPNGTELEFPDDMAEDQIQSATKSYWDSVSTSAPATPSGAVESVAAKPAPYQEEEALIPYKSIPRILIQALASPATLAGDVTSKIRNKVTGKDEPMLSEYLDTFMTDTLGLPQPEGKVDTLVQETAKRAPMFLAGGAIPQILGGAMTEAAYAPEGEEGSAAFTGALGGTLGTVAGKLLPVGVNAANWVKRRVGTPWTNIERAAGDTGINALGAENVENIISNLRNPANASNVAGFNRTAGQTAAVPANSPELAYLQKTAAQRHPGKYSTTPKGVEGQQNEALVQMLRRVSGQPGDLERAVLNRQNVTRPMYQSAEGVTSDVPPELLDVLQTDAGRSAMAQARKIASNERVPFNIEGTVATPDIPAQPGSITGRDAQIMDQSFRDLIYNAKATNTGQNHARSIGSVQRDFMDQMDELIPELGAANRAYRRMSVRPNEMSAGQQIFEKSVPEIGGQFQPKGFESAATNPELLADITPGGQRTLKTIMKELDNTTKTEDLANQGWWKGKKNIDPGEVPPTGAFNPWLAMARSAANRFLGAGSDRSINTLTGLMHDPIAFANILEKASDAERASLMRLLAESLRGSEKVLGPAGAMLTTDAFQRGN